MHFPVTFQASPLKAVAIILMALCALFRPCMADMQASEIVVACNSLARMAFDLKDLVKIVSAQRNPGPFQDVLDEFNDIFESCLTNISVMVGSPEVQDANGQQLVYEAYSNFIQGLFELMDSVGASAPTLIVLDKQAEFRIPAAVHEVKGVVDALLFQVMAVFPSASSYAMQSQNQKSQVDTHFRQAIQAFHLATASSGSPYSNTTTV